MLWLALAVRVGFIRVLVTIGNSNQLVRTGSGAVVVTTLNLATDFQSSLSTQ